MEPSALLSQQEKKETPTIKKSNLNFSLEDEEPQMTEEEKKEQQKQRFMRGIFVQELVFSSLLDDS